VYIYVCNVCVFSLPGYTEYIKSSYIYGSLDVTDFIYLDIQEKANNKILIKTNIKVFIKDLLLLFWYTENYILEQISFMNANANTNVAGCCECGHEPSDFIKFREFLD
jgi:hypothetical protein